MSPIKISGLSQGAEATLTAAAALPITDSTGTTVKASPASLALALLGSVNVKAPAYGAVGDGVTNDSAAIQLAINTGRHVFFPPGSYACSNLTQSTTTQCLFSVGGVAKLIKNANGTILASTGDNVTLTNINFRGESATPTFTGDNVTFTGQDCAMVTCGSRWAFGRALKATGPGFFLNGQSDVYATADTSATGYDIEMGVSGTVTGYHRIFGLHTSQSTGGILATDTGSLFIVGGQFGKLSIKKGTGPSGVNGGVTMAARILGNITIEVSGAIFSACEFGIINIAIAAATSGISIDASNTFQVGCTITNSGAGNNFIQRQVGTGGTVQIKYGDDAAAAIYTIDPTTGDQTFPSSLYVPNNKNVYLTNLAGSAYGQLGMSSGNNLTIANPSGGVVITTTTASDQVFLVNSAEAFRINSGGGVRLGGSAGPRIVSGTGTPEAAVTAPIGSHFLRTDGGAGTSFYVKESGAGNTGWVAK